MQQSLTIFFSFKACCIVASVLLGFRSVLSLSYPLILQHNISFKLTTRFKSTRYNTQTGNYLHTYIIKPHKTLQDSLHHQNIAYCIVVCMRCWQQGWHMFYFMYCYVSSSRFKNAKTHIKPIDCLTLLCCNCNLQ